MAAAAAQLFDWQQGLCNTLIARVTLHLHGPYSPQIRELLQKHPRDCPLPGPAEFYTGKDEWKDVLKMACTAGKHMHAGSGVP